MKQDQLRYYLDICEATAKRSTCRRAKVGALLVKDKVVLAMGFNGSPRGCNHCGCFGDKGHCLNTVHAEENCIINAARLGVPIQGAFLVCTHKPCFQCMKRLINAGIIDVFYSKDYHDEYQAKFEKHLKLRRI